MSKLLKNNVLNRLWVLIFRMRIRNFSLTECVSAFCHSALVICTVFGFNKPPWFILLLWSFYWFYSRYIVFCIQNLFIWIWSVQKWRLITVPHLKKFLAFSFFLFFIRLSWMDYFVVNSKFQTKILYRRFLRSEFWFKTWVILDVWFDRLIFFHSLFYLSNTLIYEFIINSELFIKFSPNQSNT